MSKKSSSILILFLVTTSSFFCKTSHQMNGYTSMRSSNCCIDTFKLKYQIALGGGKVKKVDDDIFVGFLKDSYVVESKAYKQLVFGDSVNSVIALVRQDEEKLNYIGLLDKDTLRENVLLYFNKKVNDKWKVHIDDSYFWRKEITFIGKEYIDNGEVYVYNIEVDKDYTSLSNNVSRIYYSKEIGFLKFVFKTHWISVEVNKIR